MSTSIKTTTSANATTANAEALNAEATNAALQVLVLTRHIHEYLKQHDPKALEQATKSLRNTLVDADRERFEASLAELSGEAEALPKARITVFLPEGHWSQTTRDGRVTFEQLDPRRN